MNSSKKSPSPQNFSESLERKTHYSGYHHNLLKAVEYAAEKHEGQVRKDKEKTPYIVHPIGVAKLLWDIGNIRSVYRSDFKNWDFGCAKAPDLTYRKCLNIHNIVDVTIQVGFSLNSCNLIDSHNKTAGIERTVSSNS